MYRILKYFQMILNLFKHLVEKSQIQQRVLVADIFSKIVE